MKCNHILVRDYAPFDLRNILPSWYTSHTIDTIMTEVIQLGHEIVSEHAELYFFFNDGLYCVAIVDFYYLSLFFNMINRIPSIFF
jgi:hypothetical protein